jgi:dGTPase
MSNKERKPKPVMTWEKLLSGRRYREAPSTVENSEVNVFQEDASRILNSTPFRRLQGKTQVHPFPPFDYLRTRLTHSIEVAHVGRVIATGAMRQLPRLPKKFKASMAGDIVSAACLAHDLGNPPFGHIGEYAIQTWFARLNEVKHPSEEIADLVAELLADPRTDDFRNFDGNAQGFRILTRLTGWRDRGGLQLSNATMGAFAKYPRSSRKAGKKRKFGYFSDDKSAATSIYGALEMLQIPEYDADRQPIEPRDPAYRRHPFAYIVEAADDISYLTSDIEDAGRMKLLSFDDCEQLLRSIADTKGHLPRYTEIPRANAQDRLKYLRAAAVSTLIDRAVECFCDREEDLLSGGFGENLFNATGFASDVAAIRRACEESIYNEGGKLQLEAAGFDIIMKVMDLYGGMMLQYVADPEKLDLRERGLFALLPPDSKEMLIGADVYKAMLVLVDYVSGMTDRFIPDLYQKLTGTNPTIGRMM